MFTSNLELVDWSTPVRVSTISWMIKIRIVAELKSVYTLICDLPSKCCWKRPQTPSFCFFCLFKKKSLFFFIMCKYYCSLKPSTSWNKIDFSFETTLISFWNFILVMLEASTSMLFRRNILFSNTARERLWISAVKFLSIIVNGNTLDTLEQSAQQWRQKQDVISITIMRYIILKNRCWCWRQKLQFIYSSYCQHEIIMQTNWFSRKDITGNYNRISENLQWYLVRNTWYV